MWLHLSVHEVNGKLIGINEFLEEGLIDDLVVPEFIRFFPEERVLFFVHDDLIAEVCVLIVFLLQFCVVEFFHRVDIID